MDIRIARLPVCWIATCLLAATAVVVPRSASADILSSYTTGFPTFAVYAPMTVTLSGLQFSVTAGTSDSDAGGVQLYSPDSSTLDYVTPTDGNQNSNGSLSLLVNLSGPDTLSGVPNSPDFTIAGAIWDPSFSYIWDSGTLLTGNVTAYEAGSSYDFIVATTGGDLQSVFGDYVELQLTDLNHGSGTPFWKMDVYAAYAIPEPSTTAYGGCLVALGMLVFLRSRRRRGLEAGPAIPIRR